VGQSRILVITPCPTHPASAGNSRRISNLMDTLLASGYDPDILYLPHFLFEVADIPEMRRRWGERLHVGQPQLGFLPAFMRNGLLWHRERALATLGLPRSPATGNGTRFDRLSRGEWARQTRRLWEENGYSAVIAEYILISRILSELPDTVLKVIDTHDVFAGRLERVRNVPRRMRWFSTTREEEAAALRRAHVTLAIQEEEAAYFRSLKANRVFTVGHLIEEVRQAGEPSGPPSIMMISSRNPTNVHGLSVFLQRTWPLVREQVPDVRLRLVGRICEGISENLPGVERLGVVADVKAAYELGHVVVNPVLEGTGLPIKTIEALMHGKALVATPSAARSLNDGAGSAFLVGEAPHEIASALVRLLRDDETRAETGAAALRYARRYAQCQLENLKMALSAPTV
jgi:glycosyltransferase involved in cell wall biosynthesis